MTKSTKSHIRERSPLLYISSRVHELVARAVRGKCVRQIAKRKSVVLSLSAISYYHACEHITRDSRTESCTQDCTPAISARRAWGSLYADKTIKINPISLCSHTDAHPNLNREVRHSPTWHSSESESALERFEPVAVVQQLPDGRGTLFALVAARRQKVFKRGILSSFCPFRSFRTSEKNSEREET